MPAHLIVHELDIFLSLYLPYQKIEIFDIFQRKDFSDFITIHFFQIQKHAHCTQTHTFIQMHRRKFEQFFFQL